MTLQRIKLGRLLIGFAFTAMLLATPVVLAAQETIVFSSNREGVSNTEVQLRSEAIDLQHRV